MHPYSCKLEPPSINNIPILGQKRHYINISSSSSDTPSTASNSIGSNANISPIIKPDIHTKRSFAAHLPPLDKKRKLTPNNIRLSNNNMPTLIQLLNELILTTPNINTNSQTHSQIQRIQHTDTTAIQTPNANANCIRNFGSNFGSGNSQSEDMRKSCHQCKTKKDVKILFYCTKKRPCCNNTLKSKTCRKKYCKSCMNKYYMDNDIIQLTNIKDCYHIWKWECPACVGICICRACKLRKRKPLNNHIQPTIVQQHRNHINRQQTDQIIQQFASINIGNNNNNNNNTNESIQPPTYESIQRNTHDKNTVLIQELMLKNPNLHLLFR